MKGMHAAAEAAVEATSAPAAWRKWCQSQQAFTPGKRSLQDLWIGFGIGIARGISLSFPLCQFFERIFGVLIKIVENLRNGFDKAPQ